MRQRKWNSLQPQSLRTKLPRISKQDETAKEKLPAEQVNECIPRQSGKLRFVIVGHRSAVCNQPKHRSDQKNSDARDDQACFPIAESKSIFTWILAKDHQHNDQWN